MKNRVLLCLIFLVIGSAVTMPVLASEAAPTDVSEINPLGPSAWKADLAIWTFVVFVLLLAVLTKIGWKPLIEGLDKREQGVANQIAQAEEANRQAKELLANYEKKLADARDEVRGILEQGRRDAEQVGRQMIDKAKEETKIEQQRAVQQIEAATAGALQELADRSAALAVDLAGKIVRAKLNSSDHAKLIEQAVAGFVRDKSDRSGVS